MQALEAGGNLRTRRCQSHWHAVRQALGGSNNVRRNFPLLNSEPAFAGASPAGLHFVGDKQPAIVLHDLEDDLEIFFRRRNEAANALDWLSQKSGNLP